MNCVFCTSFSCELFQQCNRSSTGPYIVFGFFTFLFVFHDFIFICSCNSQKRKEK
jgi:hypothetical protein